MLFSEFAYKILQLFWSIQNLLIDLKTNSYAFVVTLHYTSEWLSNFWLIWQRWQYLNNSRCCCCHSYDRQAGSRQAAGAVARLHNVVRFTTNIALACLYFTAAKLVPGNAIGFAHSWQCWRQAATELKCCRRNPAALRSALSHSLPTYLRLLSSHRQPTRSISMLFT